MKHSTNYKFNLPTYKDNELADIGVISQNFEKIDEVMKKNEDLGVELNRFEAETMDAVGRLNTKDEELQSQIDALGGVDLSEIQSQLDTKVTRKVAIVGNDSPKSSGWCKVASGTMEPGQDISLLFAVNTSNRFGPWSGILQLVLRGGDEAILTDAGLRLGWLVRTGFLLSQVIVTVDGYNWALYYKYYEVVLHQNFRVFFEVIQESSDTGNKATYNLHTDSVFEETTPVATKTSTDLGTVDTANRLTTGRYINGIAFDGSTDINITANDIASTSGNGETLYDMIVDLTARIEALENSAS